jgi:hypothetical protein
MTRMLEGKRVLRSDCSGPDTYAVVFGEGGSEVDMIVAWSTKPYAYIRVNNPTGLTFYDIFGTKGRLLVDWGRDGRLARRRV